MAGVSSHADARLALAKSPTESSRDSYCIRTRADSGSAISGPRKVRLRAFFAFSISRRLDDPLHGADADAKFLRNLDDALALGFEAKHL